MPSSSGPVYYRLSKMGRGPADLRLLLCLLLAALVAIDLPGISWAADEDRAYDFSLLVTADTEGHVGPCRQCPLHPGFGGLARRATAIKTAGTGTPPSLLIDVGNCLFGEDSLDSDGKVMIAAYDALNYDAVNLSYRDFRSGKNRTLELIKSAGTAFISANLLDGATGQLLAKPYVIRKSAGCKVALIGLTRPPAAAASLPHLKRQLGGITVRNSIESLAEWLPKAKAESDRVVLMYYGSAAGLQEIRTQFGSELSAIAVGGFKIDSLPAGGKPVLIAAEEHGKSLAAVNLSGSRGKTVADIATIPVSASLAPNDALAKILASFEPAASGPLSMPTLAAATPHTMPATRTVASSTAPATGPSTRDSVSVSRAVPIATRPVAPPAAKPHRVTARQPMTPRGLAGVELTDEKVNAAIDKGRDFLWAYLQKAHAKTLVDDAEDLLSTLALVNAGAHRKIPEFDALLRAYLIGFNPRERQLATYECGLFCMLVEAYGDPIFLPKLRDTARYLVELQGAGGSWNYGRSIPPSIYGELSTSGRALQVFGGTAFEGVKPSVVELKRITPYVKDTDGDNSVSQFALLGLHAATRWHIQASPEVWRRSLDAYRQRQCDDGGWDYEQKQTTGYGSMTCAGLCALAINRYQLGEKDAVTDEQIERGLAWLDDKFSVKQNPVRATYNYYYLYSLERVGRILNTEFIGSHEWYPLGARYLVDAQKPSGKWVESTDDENPRQATSFALLFLTRATSTLAADISRNGSGELRTSLAAAPPAQLYVILDASGSMLEEMDGQPKFDLARNAVAAMLGLLPTRSQVALRVYGHRKRSIEPDADEDTELLVPMHPYDPAKMPATLKSLRSRGKTPMALSLTQAATDIGSPREPTTVVLLTDGGEDTLPRRDPVVAAGAFANLPNLDFHIIGFDVNQEDWNTQLRAMAAAAGGHYWAAPKGKDLLRAMRAALLGDPDEFSVLDSSGKEVHRGKFGEAKRLPEGKYVIVTSFSGKEFRQPVWVNTNGVTAVTFDATQVRNDRSGTTAPVVETPAKAGTPAVPSTRFCTNCGKPVLPLAKFCTNCGAKVEARN